MVTVNSHCAVDYALPLLFVLSVTIVWLLLFHSKKVFLWKLLSLLAALHVAVVAAADTTATTPSPSCLPPQPNPLCVTMMISGRWISAGNRSNSSSVFPVSVFDPHQWPYCVCELNHLRLRHGWEMMAPKSSTTVWVELPRHNPYNRNA